MSLLRQVQNSRHFDVIDGSQVWIPHPTGYLQQEENLSAFCFAERLSSLFHPQWEFRAHSSESFSDPELAPGRVAWGSQLAEGEQSSLESSVFLPQYTGTWTLRIETSSYWLCSLRKHLSLQKSFSSPQRVKFSKNKLWEGSRGSLLEFCKQCVAWWGWQLSGYIQCKCSWRGTLRIPAACFFYFNLEILK